jgi:hypothetical protein
MRPTDFAKFQFEIAGNWAQHVVEDGSAPEHLKNLGAAVRDMAGGLQQLSIALRATFMMLEEMKVQADRAKLGRP